MEKFIMGVMATIILLIGYLHFHTFKGISPGDSVICTTTHSASQIVGEVIYIEQGIKRTKRDHYGTGYTLLYGNVHIHGYEIGTDIGSSNYYAMPKLCKKLDNETYGLILKEKGLQVD